MHAQAREIALVGLFAALTAVGAVVSVPVGAVPFTLQVMFTLLAGAVLGSRLGALSQVCYVLMGLIGLPVFSLRRAGIGVLVGPTGGFLAGFVLGAWVVGWLVPRLHRRGTWFGALGVFAAMLLGAVAIYVPGIAWLAWHLDGLAPALAAMVAFIPVDLIKAALASALYLALEARGMVPRTAAGAAGN